MFVVKYGIPCSEINKTLYGIKVKGEHGWCRFLLDGRRGFNDYSIVVPSGG
ncbi:hypothetical protein Hanom_Chr12g01106161 [Helianthus anomalus]